MGSRRRRIVLASAAVLLVLVALAGGALVAVTQTSFGREWVRAQIVEVAKRAHGRVYVGALGGGFFTGFTVDSVEIRGPDDSLFVATGPVRATYDIRDFFDQRVLIKTLEVDRPRVRIAKGLDGQWNYKRIFPPGPKKPPRTQRGFGDYIVIDSALVRGGDFTLVMPWRPTDSLRAAKRDSAVRYNLARTDREIRRVPGSADGFMQTWRWRRIEYASGYARIADPDSVGRYFDIARLGVDETVPPFRFHDVRGGARMLGDSLWLTLPRWALPASRGSATGKVVWGSDLPVRYAIDVEADTAALGDVTWVYPTLPASGGGRMHLRIENDRRDLNVINYALSRMDVRTTASRLRGAMTFGVGGAVLAVTGVDMRADPMDFRLIRQLNGKDFPYPWAGQITGWVRARGGPLNRFAVDSAAVTFRDANVPGAVHVARGRGGLDILSPAFTRFRNFAVDVERSDLSTFRFLNPAFPPLGGYVQGRAVLDSLWLDVRFRDARVRHVDGPGPPSEFAGVGRVTVGEQFLVYDLDVTAEPLSLTTLARSYPALPLRGTVRGPLRVQGTSDSLDVATTLAGPGGALQLNGHLDVYEPSYGARTAGTFRDVDLRTLLGDTTLPTTRLSGGFTSDVGGTTVADLVGPAALDLAPSTVGGFALSGGSARLAFEAGRLRVDTAAVAAAGLRAAAAGAIAITPARRDTLRWSAAADSLGGLGPLLAALGTTPPDSLGGRLVASGTLAGSLTVDTATAARDTLRLDGTLTGDGLQAGTTRVARVRGRGSVADVVRATGVDAVVLADSVRGPAALNDVRLSATLPTAGGGRVTVAGTSATGATLLATASVARDVVSTVAVIDTLTLRAPAPPAAPDARALPANRWTLDRPARVAVDSTGLTLDSLLLHGSRAGRVVAAATVPVEDSVRIVFAADSVPVSDLAALAGVRTSLAGFGFLDWRVGGYRDDPVMRFTARLDSAAVGSVRLERVTANGRYDSQRVDASLRLYEGGRSAFTADASLPLDLSLVPVEQRRLAAPLQVAVRSDSVSLATLQAFSTDVQKASGVFEATVDVGGGWDAPRLDGRAVVRDGAFTLLSSGVTYSKAQADVRLAGDSLRVEQLRVTTGGEVEGEAALRGVVRLADVANPGFDLAATMRNFNVVDRSGVGDIHVTTSAPLRLSGAVDGSRLTGGVVVSRANVAIPELATKDVVSLDDPEFYKLVDTTLTTNRTLLPPTPPAIARNLTVDNVRVVMGPDVWLRSTEANINLGGALAVTTGPRRGDPPTPTLALDGTLTAERGTYRLNVGVALQRTFEVERGTLRFYGTDADVNPAIDVSAIHTVRQVARGVRDVKVRAKIGGTLAQPTLTLESADPTLQLSQSDLISYLVTGAPSFDVGGRAGATVSSVLLPSLGGLLSGSLGGVADVVQIETVNSLDAGSSGRGLGRTTGSILGGTRLAAGWQIGARQFLSANLGLCQFGNALSGTQTFSAAELGNSIGLKYEYRFPRDLTLSAGVEPPTSALICTQSGAPIRNFVPTPRQFGLDLLRRWEF